MPETPSLSSVSVSLLSKETSAAQTTFEGFCRKGVDAAFSFATRVESAEGQAEASERWTVSRVRLWIWSEGDASSGACERGRLEGIISWPSCWCTLAVLAASLFSILCLVPFSSQPVRSALLCSDGFKSVSKITNEGVYGLNAEVVFLAAWDAPTRCTSQPLKKQMKNLLFQLMHPLMLSTNVLHYPAATIPSKCLVTFFKCPGGLAGSLNLNVSILGRACRPAALQASQLAGEGRAVVWRGQRVFPQSVTSALHCLNNIKVGQLRSGPQWSLWRAQSWSRAEALTVRWDKEVGSHRYLSCDILAETHWSSSSQDTHTHTQQRFGIS